MEHEKDGDRRENYDYQDRDRRRRRQHKRNDQDDDDDNDSDDSLSDDDDRKRRRRRRRDEERGRSRRSSDHHHESSRRRKRRYDDDDYSDSDSGDSYDSYEEERRRRKRRRRERRRRRDEDESSEEEERRRRRRKKREREEKRRDDHKKDRSDDHAYRGPGLSTLQQQQLEEKLARRQKRAEDKRAAVIATEFGYTADDNPFNDPNLHKTFTWNKKIQQQQQQSTSLSGNNAAAAADNSSSRKKGGSGPAAADHETLLEISKLRQRRQQRELEREELERLKREESRMKELENFDEWAQKEEEFHKEQQRQRSAIRLVQGRERPIDVLAKNLLLFGLAEEDGDPASRRRQTGGVNYRERYNALEELEHLDVDIDDPHRFLKLLRLHELEEILLDMDEFLALEQQQQRQNDGQGHSSNHDDNPNLPLLYWQALRLVTAEEIQFLKTGGKDGSHDRMVQEILPVFDGQSETDLQRLQGEIAEKLRPSSGLTPEDRSYWESVSRQLEVRLAHQSLQRIHQKMLVRQLERLEKKREELAKLTPAERQEREEAARKRREEQEEQEQQQEEAANAAQSRTMEEKNDGDDDDWGGDLEEEFGAASEVQLTTSETAPSNPSQPSFSWTDKYRPRKPRYFNRVKTGYDWNKYNKTHYDRDNPPPKTVQGYKFNIFYPDLIDPSKTPQFKMEPADSDHFCIIRFTAGPPYEDVAFKILNREWNRSRKHGFKCTFERGILSVYFNFKTNWYRR